MTPTRSRLGWLVLSLILAAGCNSQKGASARRKIVREDQRIALHTVRQDLERGVRGTRLAAQRMAARFSIGDLERRERLMRGDLRRIRQPPRAVDELMTTPVSFVATVGMDGKVIARDSSVEDDRMRGFDLGRVAPIVRRALREGENGFELAELPSAAEGDPPSVTILFAAPARAGDEIVGAVVAGLPLWRLGQQLSNQLRFENIQEVQQGTHVWALLYRGNDLHYHAGFPPDLRELAPGADARREGLADSPGGYTGEAYQYGRWYGYGVIPLRRVSEDLGMILFRSEPN